MRSYEVAFVLSALIFTLLIPILFIRPLWGVRSEIVFKIGLVSTAAGLMLGVATPVYLDLGASDTFFLLLAGSLIFFCFGIANLITYWWGDAGYAVCLCCCAWFVHWVTTTAPSFSGVLGLRVLVLIYLFFSSIFLINALPFSCTRSEAKIKKGELVIAIFGAIITLIKFLVIIIEILYTRR
jgi:hypothetical protein